MSEWIYFENDDYIIINKPSGLNSDVDRLGSDNVQKKVADYLQEKYPKKVSVFSQVVNRLDRPVSGLMICAKKKSILKYFNQQLSQGLIQKYYLAVVEGKPESNQQILKHYLKKSTTQFKALISSSEDPNAKEARLSYRILASENMYSLLLIQLHTGRYHQIRCQMAEIACPLWNDKLYGAQMVNSEIGIGLSSIKLEFTDMKTGQEHIYFCIPSNNIEPWSLFTNQLIRLDSDFKLGIDPFKI